MKKNKPLLKGALILTVASVFSRILGFLYRIFLSNIIGAEGMGIFQMIFPVFILCVSICSGGIQIAVSRFVAESSQNKIKCLSVLRASILMSGAFSLITAFALCIFSNDIAIFALGDIRCAALLKYIAIAVPFAAFHSCVIGYYLGVKNTNIPALAQIFEQLFKFISLYVMYLVFSGNGHVFSAKIAVISVVISELAGSLFLLTAIYTTRLSLVKGTSTGVRKINPVQKLKNTFSDIKQLFSISYILTLNKIMLNFLQSLEAIIIPIALVKYGLDRNESLSIYGILTGMSLPVISFPSALISSLSMVIMPMVAEANVYGKSGSLKHATNVSTQVSCICGIFCFGMFMFFGDFIGSVVFGHPLAGSYIKNLAWLCPFMYLSISLGSILHGLGKTSAAFWHNLTSLIIRIAFIWFLVPQIGITAYFWGLLISTLATVFLHAYVIATTIDFNFSAMSSIIKPALWLIISLSAGLFLENILKLIFTFLCFSGLIAEIVSVCLCGVFMTLLFGFFMISSFKKAN